MPILLIVPLKRKNAEEQDMISGLAHMGRISLGESFTMLRLRIPREQMQTKTLFRLPLAML